MVDSLYQACYHDEEGTILGPWAIVNNDWGSKAHLWGWNEKTLLVFYAKNLCYMGSPLLNTSGLVDIEDNPTVWLVPKGFDPVGEYRKAKRERLAKDLLTTSLKSFAMASGQ